MKSKHSWPTVVAMGLTLAAAVTLIVLGHGPEGSILIAVAVGFQTAKSRTIKDENDNGIDDDEELPRPSIPPTTPPLDDVQGGK